MKWLVALVLLVPSCQDRETAPPAIETVEPAVVVEGKRQPLSITGRFYLDVSVSYLDSSRSRLGTEFSAWLVAAPPSQLTIALEDVEYVDFNTLRAVAPITIPRGFYSLGVQDPSGETGVLAEAILVRPEVEWVQGPRCDDSADCADDPCSTLDLCESGFCVNDKDVDGDGRVEAACGGTDCDDTCAACWTGQADICDGYDNDCDGSLDEDVDLVWYADADGDGYGDVASSLTACTRPNGYVAENTDCADTPGSDPACNNLDGASCHPGLAGSDTCDGADNDCDGSVDEDSEVVWYADADGDTYGDATATRNACSQPGGYVADNTDCADTPGSDPACNSLDGASCHPGLAGSDTCDGADNDCDGSVDEDPELVWYADADGDTYGDAATTLRSCFHPAGYVADNTDCADTPGSDPACNNLDGASCHPGLAGSDTCDGADNDCDGSVDEDSEVVWYADADGDTYGDAAATRNACTQPGGYVADNTDCADTPGSDPACNSLDGASCHPGLAGSDTCDGADNDCDGPVDEDPEVVWYADADGDTYGDAAATRNACSQPGGYVADNTDCADTPGSDPACNNLDGASCHPGLAGSDTCDGADNDCDGSVDEDPELVWYADADGDTYGDAAATLRSCFHPAGYVADNTDCADTPGSDPACNNLDGANCHPGLAGSDTCDGADNDCDGTVDENCGSQALLQVEAGSPTDFGNFLLTWVSERTVVVKNNGTAAASSMADGGGMQAPFRYKGGAYPGTGGSCMTDLAVDASCSVVLEAVSASEGAFVDDLLIDYNNGAGPDQLSQSLVFDAVSENHGSILFVTIDAGRPTMFGSVAGADDYCQSAAESAGFEGQYRAVISDSTVDAIDHVQDVIYPIVRVDLTVVVPSNLWDGTGIAAAIQHEDGSAQATSGAWTGSLQNGTSSGKHCTDWTYFLSSQRGTVGFNTTDANWIGHSGPGSLCNSSFSLYCIQTGP